MWAAMKVGLFIPCYVDQLYPQVGWATVEVLAHCGVTPEFPAAQTCCGQPLANSGCVAETGPLARRFIEVFADYDYIVAPSGSCVSMVRHHYDPHFAAGDRRAERVRERTLELSEFLVQVLGVRSLAGRFPHQVGLHASCHGLRELRLGSSSEVMQSRDNLLVQLLSGLEGLRWSQLKRPDECCGFGGTFAVAEEAVSCLMGQDRIVDHQQAGTEVLTAGDMSCLMHLEGLIRRQGLPLRVLHFAEILAEAIRSASAVASPPRTAAAHP